MGCIYKITNDINHKVYIGQTVQPLYGRWSMHKHRARCGYKTHLYSAMNKYGIDAFSIEEIEKCPNSILDDRERYWIRYYNSYNSGYNETLGGQDSKRMYVYEEICECLLNGEEKNTVAEKFHCSRKTVYNACVSILGDNPKNIFKQYWKAKVVKYYKAGLTPREITEKVPQSFATVYTYLREEGFTFGIRTEIMKKLKQQRIYQLDKSGKELNVFNTIKEASKETGTSIYEIQKSINDHIVNGKYIWRRDWIEDE